MDDGNDFIQAARRWAAAHGTPNDQSFEHLAGEDVSRTISELTASFEARLAEQNARAHAAEVRCAELEATLQRYAEHGTALEVGCVWNWFSYLVVCACNCSAHNTVVFLSHRC